MSAEPFTAFAFAVELRLPGSDQPLCEAAFCACDGLELRREIIRARDGADPTNVRLLPGAESFGNVILRARDDVELRPLGLVGARAARPGRPRHLRHRRPVARPGAGARALSPVPLPAGQDHRPRRSTRPATTSPSSRWSSPARGSTSSAPATSRRGAAHEPVAKAQLRELDASFEREINKARWVTVQINPHELRTSFSHELGPTTRLDLRLTFDVDAPAPRGRRAPDDVRRLTERVAYFATPRAVRGGAATRPAVRLAWGTFQFDGHVEALEETLEAFSPDGRPLRATLALSLARAQIAPYAFAAPAGAGGRG